MLDEADAQVWSVLEELHAKAAEIRGALREQAKTRAALRQARGELARREAAHLELSQRVAADAVAIERRNGLGAGGSWSQATSTNRALDRAHRAYFASRLAHEQNHAALAHLRAEIPRLEAALGRHGDLEGEHAELVAAQERLLGSLGDPRARALAREAERQGELRTDLDEVGEAIQAGQIAAAAVEEVASIAGAAQTFGVLDRVRDGIFSASKRYEKLREAAAHARNAQVAIVRFQQELADADARRGVDVPAEDLSHFAESFLSRLVSDLEVKADIARALSTCASTHRAIGDAVRALEAYAAEKSRELDSCEDAWQPPTPRSTSPRPRPRIGPAKSRLRSPFDPDPS